MLNTHIMYAISLELICFIIIGISLMWIIHRLSYIYPILNLKTGGLGKEVL